MKRILLNYSPRQRLVAERIAPGLVKIYREYQCSQDRKWRAGFGDGVPASAIIELARKMQEAGWGGDDQCTTR